MHPTAIAMSTLNTMHTPSENSSGTEQSTEAYHGDEVLTPTAPTPLPMTWLKEDGREASGDFTRL